MMDTLLTFMKIVALASVSALCIYFVTVLKQLLITLNEVGRDLHDISTKAGPVLENLDAITAKAKSIMDNVDGEVDKLRSTVSSIRLLAESMVDFGSRVQTKIEEPVMDAVGFISGVVKGVGTVLRILRPGRNGGSED